ncbi:hypothetical protein GI584_14355 [Gracilibacillus salitolerans]|uniref:Uncharacterized protein n=1 Tax=Gracilibacillus salitolerans TaxID=2663022 RepID=A0A5Q2TJP2_9BACI|nr:hypothetical protein [Gracilibacillus salitolerans]QGH35154.1 hypothetical protein GI584_14355 [Gracilibacillus salitolerans]
MNWDNIFKILGKYTQLKHYNSIFETLNIKKSNSREKMANILCEKATSNGFFGPELPEPVIKEWLNLHQIDGNNYTFVYNLQENLPEGLLYNLYANRENYTQINLWDINPDNESEDLSIVMPKLNDILLTGIYQDKSNDSYTFSFVAPSVISGSRIDGSTRLYKKLFFCHCVFYNSSKNVKVVLNPSANLHNVNGVKKNRYDWTPIANMIFNKAKDYVGQALIYAPKWIPEALYKFAEQATNHNNPQITEASFKAQESIEEFSNELLKVANIDVDQEPALHNRLIQDIQFSYEAQLMEIHKTDEEDGEEVTIFKQRSDGISHIISVESTEEGFRSGAAAQAARRSRQDGLIDLLGVSLKTNDRAYKFLVEQGIDAYLIRGTNTFVEERVVNIVIDRLNKYREEIYFATQRDESSRKTNFGSPSK